MHIVWVFLFCVACLVLVAWIALIRLGCGWIHQADADMAEEEDGQ